MIEQPMMIVYQRQELLENLYATLAALVTNLVEIVNPELTI